VTLHGQVRLAADDDLYDGRAGPVGVELRDPCEPVADNGIDVGVVVARQRRVGPLREAARGSQQPVAQRLLLRGRPPLVGDRLEPVRGDPAPH
jgi:hypothetical protein